MLKLDTSRQYRIHFEENRMLIAILEQLERTFRKKIIGCTNNNKSTLSIYSAINIMRIVESNDDLIRVQDMFHNYMQPNATEKIATKRDRYSTIINLLSVAKTPLGINDLPYIISGINAVAKTIFLFTSANININFLTPITEIFAHHAYMSADMTVNNTYANSSIPHLAGFANTYVPFIEQYNALQTLQDIIAIRAVANKLYQGINANDINDISKMIKIIVGLRSEMQNQLTKIECQYSGLSTDQSNFLHQQIDNINKNLDDLRSMQQNSIAQEFISLLYNCNSKVHKIFFDNKYTAPLVEAINNCRSKLITKEKTDVFKKPLISKLYRNTDIRRRTSYILSRANVKDIESLNDDLLVNILFKTCVIEAGKEHRIQTGNNVCHGGGITC